MYPAPTVPSLHETRRIRTGGKYDGLIAEGPEYETGSHDGQQSRNDRFDPTSRASNMRRPGSGHHLDGNVIGLPPNLIDTRNLNRRTWTS